MKLSKVTAVVAGLCLCSVGALPSCNSTRKIESDKPPGLRPLNVVVVTIDTLRPDHLPGYGYQHVETPTLDSLAQRGVLFEQAVAQTPLTPPSHASIFTGQYPTVHHVRNTGGFILPTSSRPLAKTCGNKGGIRRRSSAPPCSRRYSGSIWASRFTTTRCPSRAGRT